jgi:hypothetical protein
VGVAHVALELGARHERGDGVNGDDVDGAAADEGLADLERLLAGVGLGDEQVVDLDAALLGVLGVESVLGVDEGGDAAAALGLGDDVLDEGSLAGRLGAEDLGDAAAGDAADAEGEVERDGAGGDDVDGHAGADLAEAHDGALAEAALDLGQRKIQCLLAILIHAVSLLPFTHHI